MKASQSWDDIFALSSVDIESQGFRSQFHWTSIEEISCGKFSHYQIFDSKIRKLRSIQQEIKSMQLNDRENCHRLGCGNHFSLLRLSFADQIRFHKYYLMRHQTHQLDSFPPPTIVSTNLEYPTDCSELNWLWKLCWQTSKARNIALKGHFVSWLEESQWLWFIFSHGTIFPIASELWFRASFSYFPFAHFFFINLNFFMNFWNEFSFITSAAIKPYWESFPAAYVANILIIKCSLNF